MKIINQESVRKENLIHVLQIISQDGPISRADITKRMKMSATSSSRILQLLEELELIKELDIEQNKIGRRSMSYIVNEDAVLFVGVQVDKTYFKVGIMNFSGELIYVDEYDYEFSEPESSFDFIIQKVNQLLKKMAISHEKIAGVCLGIPGIIDTQEGRINFSVQLELKMFPIREYFMKKTGFPIMIDNELKLKALAEFELIKGQGIHHLVVIGIGSGVGSAVISGGELSRGSSNFFGEIGHTIVDPTGTYCPCGNFGCLQTYIAEPFLINEASKIKKISSVEEIFNEAEKGEHWAKNLADNAVKYTNIAINNTVCSYNPNRIVLTGSMIEKYPYFSDRVMKEYIHTVWAPAKDCFDITLSKSSSNGIIAGAAMQVKKLFIEEGQFLKER